MQLHGKNINDIQQNANVVNVGKDVGEDVGEDKLFAESTINSAKERRKKILSLLRLQCTA